MNAKRIAIFAILAVTSLASPFARAEGEPLDETMLNAVRTNCVSAQVSIQRLQTSDKPTRINRGYLYETLLRLMVNFNSRVAQNKIDSPELLTITSDYEKQLKAFTTDYTKYDEGLSELIAMDCQSNPTLFYGNLVKARELRNSLNMAVVNLEALIDRYQADIGTVKNVVESGI